MTKWMRAFALGFYILAPIMSGQDSPHIVNGQAQVVSGFANPDSWIREDLWVETEFDSDGDGLLDRMYVAVTRPVQTNFGLKLPVIYESSPYYAGTAGNDRDLFWNVKHELGEVPETAKTYRSGAKRGTPDSFEFTNQHVGSQRICGGALQLARNGVVGRLTDGGRG